MPASAGWRTVVSYASQFQLSRLSMVGLPGCPPPRSSSGRGTGSHGFSHRSEAISALGAGCGCAKCDEGRLLFPSVGLLSAGFLLARALRGKAAMAGAVLVLVPVLRSSVRRSLERIVEPRGCMRRSRACQHRLRPPRGARADRYSAAGSAPHRRPTHSRGPDAYCRSHRLGPHDLAGLGALRRQRRTVQRVCWCAPVNENAGGGTETAFGMGSGERDLKSTVSVGLAATGPGIASASPRGASTLIVAPPKHSEVSRRFSGYGSEGRVGSGHPARQSRTDPDH